MQPLNIEVSRYFTRLNMHQFASSSLLETHRATLIAYMRVIEREAIKQKNIELLQELFSSRKESKGYDKH